MGTNKFGFSWPKGSIKVKIQDISYQNVFIHRFCSPEKFAKHVLICLSTQMYMSSFRQIFNNFPYHEQQMC